MPNLEDVLHQVALALESIPLDLEIELVIEMLVNLLLLTVLLQ